MIYCKETLLILILFFFNSLNSQNIYFKTPDSLKNKSLYEIEKLFYSSEQKSIEDSIYSNTYLQKAFSIKDSVKIAKGYLFLTSSCEEDLFETYVDKSIQFSKNRNSFIVPATAYSMKASICKKRKEFKKALDYYLLTHEACEKSGNYRLKRITKYNIGVLKTKIGNHKEALEYFLEYWNSYNDKEKYEQHHLKTFFAISNAYTKNMEYDSATYYNNLGIKYSNLFKDEKQKNDFIFLEGINHYYQENYMVTIDSINKSIPTLISTEQIDNLSVCYAYLGKSYINMGLNKTGIDYLKKVDSIFNKTQDLLPRCRDIYRILIDNSKDLNNYRQQLYYTNQLIRLDSILNDNYKYLNSTIYKKYETPNLKKEKRELENILKNEREFYKILILFILLVSTAILIFYYTKSKKQRKNYEKLIEQIDQKIEEKNKVDKQLQHESIDSIDEEIDMETVNKILKALAIFETSEGYLNNKLTLRILAKKLNTNSRYLSKVINYYKEKTYTNYINDLRIEYVLNKLRADKKFRKYTVESIALSSGFNSRRAFSNVFSKKTGISASYLIKNLNKEDK